MWVHPEEKFADPRIYQDFDADPGIENAFNVVGIHNNIFTHVIITPYKKTYTMEARKEFERRCFVASLQYEFKEIKGEFLVEEEALDLRKDIPGIRVDLDRCYYYPDGSIISIEDTKTRQGVRKDGIPYTVTDSAKNIVKQSVHYIKRNRLSEHRLPVYEVNRLKISLSRLLGFEPLLLVYTADKKDPRKADLSKGFGLIPFNEENNKECFRDGKEIKGVEHFTIIGETHGN